MTEEQNSQAQLEKTKSWILDQDAREVRALLLNDWDTAVRPALAHAERSVAHSVTYGSTALQAAYLINGGALAGLPAIMSVLTRATSASIAHAAIPFILGIVAAALCSIFAYLNFQFQAQMYWFDANLQGAQIRKMYQLEATVPDKANRKMWERLINGTLFLGFTSGLASLVFFVWGASQFIDLAMTAHK